MPKGVEGSDAGTSGALQYSRGSKFAGSKRVGNEIGNEGGNQQGVALDDPIEERGENLQGFAVEV